MATIGMWLLVSLGFGSFADQLTWGQTSVSDTIKPQLNWRALPDLPDPLGLAGPIVGVHNDRLIVGGGANFAEPLWENTKRWHAQIFTLNLADPQAKWQSSAKLNRPLAYAACASTPEGVVVIGGNDDQHVSAACWLLRYRQGELEQISLPEFPIPCVYAQAAWLENRVMVFGGQSGQGLESAHAQLWALDLTNFRSGAQPSWKRLLDCPGDRRAHHVLVAMGRGTTARLFLAGGRRQQGQSVQFLGDCWMYWLAEGKWTPCRSMPVPLSAGGAVNFDDRTVGLLSGDDGSLFSRTEELRDQHPGFTKRAWLYDVAGDRWSDGGVTPANQVTTLPVLWRGKAIMVSGEVRPRKRTSRSWEIELHRG